MRRLGSEASRLLVGSYSVPLRSLIGADMRPQAAAPAGGGPPELGRLCGSGRHGPPGPRQGAEDAVPACCGAQGRAGAEVSRCGVYGRGMTQDETRMASVESVIPWVLNYAPHCTVGSVIQVPTRPEKTAPPTHQLPEARPTAAPYNTK